LPTAQTATIQSDNTDTNDTLKAPPVSLITVSIPVQFQITNVMDWAYNNGDPTNLLTDLATREVVHFLAGVDLVDFLSHARLEARGHFAAADSGRRERYTTSAQKFFLSGCRTFIRRQPWLAITKKSSARIRHISPKF
jgi:hypothetical protein